MRSERLVLASASTARARLLREAGVAFAVEPAGIDEDAVKRASRDAGETALSCAMTLAVAKARAGASRRPDSLTIGADQILVMDEAWFDKPPDLMAAREQLRRLRGRTHVLATVACVCCGDAIVWRATSEPRLTMRAFSDAFVESYLARAGDAVLGSVGAYRLEGLGVQLFDRIEGDHFAIQGLPLVELLDYLRQCGVLAV